MTRKQMIYEVCMTKGLKSHTTKKFYAYAMTHTEEETRKEFEKIAKVPSYSVKSW